MSKNFFNKIKESFFSSKHESNDKSFDFDKAKRVLFSSKNREELISAVKYINNFNKKYEITEQSPEFIYFERMIKLMKVKIRNEKIGGSEIDESYRVNLSLRNIIKESLDELDWIKNQHTSFDPKFEFNDMEYWVDISGLDTSEKIVVLNFILDLESIDDRERGFYRRHVLKYLSIYNGVVVHCGNEGNDYVPKNGEICFMRATFNDDEQAENSIHVDGREVLEYINLIDGEEEELEESLEWSDKDSSYSSDEKFTADPNWKGDENWTPNPEKSYWKQGDAGGGGDMNESQDLDWIKDVSDKLPSYDQRTRIDLKDFLIDYMEYNLDILDFLHGEDIFVPTERFIGSYTPEEWDDEGLDYWRDVAWKEEGNSKWEYDEPPLNYWELLEYLQGDSDEWEFVDRITEDYDLEYGSFSDLYIYKRKKDGRYFALPIKGNTYDGITHNDNFLFEVFPRMRLVYESRKDLIKKILVGSKLN